MSMNEKTFWEIIDYLDWDELGDDEAVLEPAIALLSEFEEDEICKFDDILATKLHDLDTEPHARHIGEDSFDGDIGNFSTSEFLYARCLVVAQGEDMYYEVLEDPTRMPQDEEFEGLLYLASSAHERKTGQKYEYTTKINFETFANQGGWSQLV